MVPNCGFNDRFDRILEARLIRSGGIGCDIPHGFGHSMSEYWKIIYRHAGLREGQ